MSTRRRYSSLRLGTLVACVLLSACTSTPDALQAQQQQQQQREQAGMASTQAMPPQTMGGAPMTGGGPMMGQGQSGTGQLPPMAQMRLIPADPALMCAMHAQVTSARSSEERRERMNSLFHGLPPEMQEQHFRMMQPQCQQSQQRSTQ